MFDRVARQDEPAEVNYVTEYGFIYHYNISKTPSFEEKGRQEVYLPELLSASASIIQQMSIYVRQAIDSNISDQVTDSGG